MNALVEQFADLFEGRTDAYGRDDGGCIRVMGSSDPEFTTTVRYLRHLSGEEPFGVYPMVKGGAPISQAFDPNYEGDWRVKWGCVDLDIKTPTKPAGDYENEHQAHDAARNLQSVLRRVGATSWIERTKSGGRHVWVFADSWVPARTMRNALNVACEVAGTSTREINPKSASLSEGQVGNYVRLPYPGMIEPLLLRTHQAVVNAMGSSIHLEDFVTQALAERTSLATLESIAAKYREPAKPTVQFMPTVSAYVDLRQKLGPLSRHYLASGNTADRSKLIEAFVRSAKDDGLTPAETLVVTDELARAVGKFEGRKDRDEQLRRIVERAWT